MDYGQYSLSGAEDDDLDWADASQRALELALSGDGIGQVGNLVTVLSPHQNNFAMSVTFELWARPPSDDLEDWEEAFEAQLDVDSEGLKYGSPTLGGELIVLEPGRYGLRICGRGFVARGWPGSTQPGDSWRWQAWPTQQELPARRLRAWSL